MNDVGVTRFGGSLGEAVGVLARAESTYRDSQRFFIEAVEGRREVVIERVDGKRVEVKYGGAAKQPRTVVEGVRETWRAAGPAGAKALARWFEGR